jgi:hypothetical protein
MADEITVRITNQEVRKRPSPTCLRPLTSMELKEGNLMMLFGQPHHIARRYISAADNLRLRGVEPEELIDLYLSLQSPR